MTFLTKTEISRFRRLIDSLKWEDAAVFGEELLRKDPRDGAGIRFGVMDAYAALGDAYAAEELAQRYCDYSPEYWDAPTYKTAREIMADWDDEAHERWMETVSGSMLLQLAMAYWKAGMEEEAANALRVLPDEGKEYLLMSGDQLSKIRKKLDHQGFYQPRTLEEYVECITIPYRDQLEFRKWFSTYTP